MTHFFHTLSKISNQVIAKTRIFLSFFSKLLSTSMLQGILPREYPVTLRMCAHTITRNHSLLYNRNHWNVLTKELQHIWLQTADWSIWHIRYLKSYRVFSGGLVSSLRMPCSIEVELLSHIIQVNVFTIGFFTRNLTFLRETGHLRILVTGQSFGPYWFQILIAS